mmetsp:Transcript_46421/g.121854  ORF Transcript_46421/g.121854 Transcript_46421/m.121854 type:complete len:244 (-) Transcript_46421:1604-2335(-)
MRVKGADDAGTTAHGLTTIHRTRPVHAAWPPRPARSRPHCAGVTPSICGRRSRDVGRLATIEPASSSSMRCRMRAISAPPPPSPPKPVVDEPPIACCRCCCFICLISRRRSLISLTSVTFSCIMRMLSLLCSSLFLASLRLRDSTDFSRYSRWRAYSAAMSGSTAREGTASVTCFWYIFRTDSLRAFGSWMCWTVSCSSVFRPRTLASWSPSFVRCERISRCMPSSLRRRSEMVRSSAELFLW